MSGRRYAVELWSWDVQLLGRVAIYRTRRRAARRRPKTRFASYDEAALALVDAKIERAFRKRLWQKRCEQRVYYCGDCNGHHLSSLPDDGRTRAR